MSLQDLRQKASELTHITGMARYADMRHLLVKTVGPREGTEAQADLSNDHTASADGGSSEAERSEE